MSQDKDEDKDGQPRESFFSVSHLPHVVSNVKVHVHTDDQSDEVLRQRKVLVNDGKM